MTNLEEIKLVSMYSSFVLYIIEPFEIYWTVSVHSNKQNLDRSDREVETIIKDQLITEYEFYNYIKQRLARQAKALSVT